MSFGVWNGPLEEIEVLAVAFGGELLHLHAELGGELLQIFMIGVHELAAEFAEHALVEIVLGEHASAPTIARLEHDRLRAGGLQTIGRGQPGDAAADDGDRARLPLSWRKRSTSRQATAPLRRPRPRTVAAVVALSARTIAGDDSRRHGKNGPKLSLRRRTKACATWQGPRRCDEGDVLCSGISAKLGERRMPGGDGESGAARKIAA